MWSSCFFSIIAKGAVSMPKATSLAASGLANHNAKTGNIYVMRARPCPLKTVIYSPYSTSMEMKHERHDEQNLTGYPAGGGRVEFFLFRKQRSPTRNAGLLLGRGKRDFRG